MANVDQLPCLPLFTQQEWGWQLLWLILIILYSIIIISIFGSLPLPYECAGFFTLDVINQNDRCGQVLEICSLSPSTVTVYSSWWNYVGSYWIKQRFLKALFSWLQIVFFQVLFQSSVMEFSELHWHPFGHDLGHREQARTLSPVFAFSKDNIDMASREANFFEPPWLPLTTTAS